MKDALYNAITISIILVTFIGGAGWCIHLGGKQRLACLEIFKDKPITEIQLLCNKP